MSKFLKLFLLTTAVAAGLGCVSPFYGTARIEKGWNMDVGVAACTFANTLGTLHYLAGMRGDCEIRYGINNYFQANGRIGAGFGYKVLSDEQEPTKNGPFLLLDGALGLQAAYSINKVTPALRIEAGPVISIIPVVGFGNHEWLSIGSKISTPYDTKELIPELFVTIHLLERWSIFGGVNMLTIASPEWEYPVASLGVGYNIFR
ncbi:hypothetical protein GF338_09255 [candidate division WOR-3 bacterium]|nr:hypothetical protein [candidate division WOR-3 bacterium]